MAPLTLSYVTLQEQHCVLRWFLSWINVCTLFESLKTLQVKDSPPNIFECQLRLWTQWFESWSEEERNSFLHILEERDPIFVAYFYRGVAGTASRD
uniref:Chromosome 14 open reading frame 119 n=1 Tax=Hucho hucho TaxID=62062 RepID=A0A4W5LF01_9TELE